MEKFVTACFVFLAAFAITEAGYRYPSRSSFYRSLSRKLVDLERKFEALSQPVHVHVHGNDEDHAAHSNLKGAHIHMHLSVDGQPKQMNQMNQMMANEYAYASCSVQPNTFSNSFLKVTGTVHFRQKPSSQLEIKGKLHGFPGEGEHGFHVHQLTDYTKGCNSFGGHFNPFNKTHGGPDDDVRHVGDFGNVRADRDGRARIDLVDRLASLFGPASIVGRGLVIHEGTDDLGRGGDAGSLATGNAGPRLACCVIGYTNDNPW